VKWYAREHVVLCLVPAFFIAGAISAFVGQASVMKYLGAGANRFLAYGVASVSGTVLAVCSCTVLPLFNGIYRMGAGLGPATTFLYAGPAINVLAIILTARILGPKLGVARALGAVLFSIAIGALMHLMFRNDERERVSAQPQVPGSDVARPLWQNALYFASMVAILVFANWGQPETSSGVWNAIFRIRWLITSGSALALSIVLVAWFGVSVWKLAFVAAATAVVAVLWGRVSPLLPFATGSVLLSAALSTEQGETSDWFFSSLGFAKQILPLLLGGVIIAGLLLGRVGHDGLVPSQWIQRLVGGNSVWANLFASVVGAFMYFATLTEVPILQGLIGNGMGQGPALALLLAGPALSLPNMLVINSVIGPKKTVAFVILVIIMATISGILYGIIA
jgi:uncharacterized membrane protein YraQ (UPF0718 family)